MQRPLRPLGLAQLAPALLVLAASACVTAGASAPADAASFDAEGIYVRHVRLRLAPSHTQDFEALVARCRAAAEAADLPREYSWLCYREPPGRYWLIGFSETEDGFVLPETPDPLVGFARDVARAEGEAALAEVEERLTGLDYEVEWTLVTRQKSGWSTVEEMTTATHPMARMMIRTVRPGAEAAFDRALSERTAFLKGHGYPLPIEGFVTLRGAPGTAMQVVFPVDWPSFHARDSFGAFVRGLDDAARGEYARHKQALMVTMDRAEFYDAQALRELAYGE